jgi:hypothetical protein
MTDFDGLTLPAMRAINEAKAQSFFREKPERRRELMNYSLVYPKRKSGFVKSAALCFLGLAMILLTLSQGYAQRQPLSKFKGVETPFKLIYGDTVIEKGVYDFEFSVMVVGSQILFYLSIKKDKKIICEAKGERFKYGTDFIPTLIDDPKIPKKPSLTFKIIPEEKTFVYIFETGKEGRFDLERTKFFFKYETGLPELPE